MDSLKDKLIQNIKDKQGKLYTHREVVLFCIDENRKPDNATRRLREVRDKTHKDFDPHVQVVEEKGVIKGYYWSGSVTPNLPPVRTFKPSTDNCNGDYKCYHYRTFKYCKCEVKQEIKQSLF